MTMMRLHFIGFQLTLTTILLVFPSKKNDGLLLKIPVVT